MLFGCLVCGRQTGPRLVGLSPQGAFSALRSGRFLVSPQLPLFSAPLRLEQGTQSPAPDLAGSKRLSSQPFGSVCSKVNLMCHLGWAKGHPDSG